MESVAGADVSALYVRLGLGGAEQYTSFDSAPAALPTRSPVARAEPPRPVAAPAVRGAGSVSPLPLDTGRAAVDAAQAPVFDLPGIGRVSLSIRPLPPPVRAPRVLCHALQGGAGASTLALGLALHLAQSGWSPRLLAPGGRGAASLGFPRVERLPAGGAAWLDPACGEAEAAAAIGLAWPAPSLLAEPDWPQTLEQQAATALGAGGARDFSVIDLPTDAGGALAQAAVDLALIVLRPDPWAPQAVEALLQGSGAQLPRCLFVLNRHDANQPVHREVAQALRERLGPRLAPLALPEDAGLGAALMARTPQQAPLWREAGFQALCAQAALAALQARAD